MVNGARLKHIAQKRLDAAKVLADAGDFDGAGQMLGLALECALKSACCKALRLAEYPIEGRDKEEASYFKTHNFDRLLTVSGCEDLFAYGREYGSVWSEFTILFAGKGKWIEMRYEDGVFSGRAILNLINSLEGADKKIGIFTILTKCGRW